MSRLRPSQTESTKTDLRESQQILRRKLFIFLENQIVTKNHLDAPEQRINLAESVSA